MNSADKKTKEALQKKLAYIDQNEETITNWKQTIQDLMVYDPAFEDQKYYIKEVNLIEYILCAIELMSQVKGYSEDSFIIAMIRVTDQKRKTAKILMTSFVKSFQTQVPYSNELSYYTILLSPSALPEKTPQMLQFYLKLRKYIYQHFVNERDTVVKPMNFDQWVSVVSKFMDNSAISIIGNKIKEQVLKTKNNEKIMKNNVMPLDLLRFCYELFEERNPQQCEPKQRQVPTFSPQENDEFTADQKQKPTAQQLAYKMMMPIHTKQNASPQGKPDTVEKVVKIHEDLAYNYKLLANYAHDVKKSMQQFIQKIKSQQPITEMEIKELESMARFNQFLPIDPEVSLKESGIYDIL